MLHTRQYPVIIDGEEGAYGAVFPDLPGVVAMGDTIHEALANAAEALAEAIREAKTHGETLPSPSRAENLQVPADARLVTWIVLAQEMDA